MNNIPRKYTHHQENCNNSIRMFMVDMLGRKIILSSTHTLE